MIIKSIELENFLSYYGKSTLNFEEGPTIIIGQNNTGKSKLFDAFNWVLYDQAFKTKDEIWAKTKEWKEELVNNNAKLTCNNGEVINTSVCIVLLDENQNKFVLTREYEIKKIGENKFESPTNSNLYLSKTEAITHNTTDYFNHEADEEIRKLFPINLSRYFLFQGENISQIMNLSSRSAFNKALRDLSRIEVFEIAKRCTNKVYKKIQKEFEEIEDRDKKTQAELKGLGQKIDTTKVSIEKHEKQFDELCSERNKAREVLNKKVEELKKFEECAKIIKDIESIEDSLRTKNDFLSEIFNNKQRDIFGHWMYAGTEKVLDGFLKIYNKNKIEKKIPEPIRQDFVKEMLKEKICKICGTQAPKNSEQYKQILTFLNDKSLDEEIALINSLSYVADTYVNKVKDIKNELKQFNEKRAKISNDLSKLQGLLKIKKEDFKNVIPKGISEDEVKLKDFERLQSDKDKIESEWETIKDKINMVKVKKELEQNSLEDLQKQYDLLVNKSSNPKEGEKLKLAIKINNTTAEFYDKFFQKLIKDIQERANYFFSRMTEKNQALSGNVKVDSELNEVYTIDEDGNRIYNINQANKVSLQISFVAAVLDVSNNFWNTFFPFIADATISALGGNNKLTAIETMIDIFKQSIIILKDDAFTDDSKSLKNDLTRNLISTNKKIKKAYELKMKGEKIEQQYTKIIELK